MGKGSRWFAGADIAAQAQRIGAHSLLQEGGDRDSKLALGPQVAVVGAMGLVVFAASLWVVSEGFVSGFVATLGGVSTFVMFVSAHGLMRLYKRNMELFPRVDRVETAVVQLQNDAEAVAALSDKVDVLSRHVSDIQRWLGTQEEAAGATSERRNDLGVLSEMAGLEEEISRLRDDLEDVKSQRAPQMGSEVQVLHTLVKQLAERQVEHSVTGPEAMKEATELFENNGLAEMIGSDDPLSDLQPGLELDGGEYEGEQIEAVAENLSTESRDGSVLDMVRQSIEANRVELYLQPIVTLPERDVRFYEALTRLRDSGGGLVLPDRYMDLAEQAGMMPLIDNIMLFRTVQVIRRLAERDSSRAVFCNISATSLLDPEFFPEFIAFMSENQHLNDHLVFEFSQSMVRDGGRGQRQAMKALAELGFKFSLDQVTDLTIDYRDLVEQAFRYLKVDVRIFLHGMAEAGASIHAADMARYLERQGLTLIVEKVEDERSAASLLDYEVQMSQGYLFSEPRPVRPEVFDAAA